jgi:EAL domain-containing protein (putative c-di-GMP-specific phosphodiesterase class I)/ABC-type amino acid transport substrate-binding protein
MWDARRILHAVCLAVAVSTASAQGIPERLVFGGDAAYPPFEWQDNGRPRGFDIDLEDAIASLGGVTPEHRLGDWPGTIRALQSGDIDVVAMFHSEAREDLFLFTPPFHFVNHGVYARDDFQSFSTIDELHGRRVAVEELSYAHQQLESERFQAELVLMSNTLMSLQAVADGAADYAILAAPTANYLIRERGMGLRNVGPPLWPRGYAFAVRKDRPELARWLTEQYYATLRTGAYQEIYERWQHELAPTEEGLVSRTLKLALAPLAIAALLGLLWAGRLRRVVAVRTRGLAREARRRHAAESQARWMQDHDAYTALPRLHVFSERVGELLARMNRTEAPARQVVALKLVDLDRTIRTLGHEAGLAATRDFAQRLQAMEFECYGQSSRDVFLIFGEKRAILEKLRGCISVTDTVVLEADPAPRLFAGASTWPDHGEGPADLLRRAETALAVAMDRREDWVEYGPSMEPNEDDLELLSLFRRSGGEGLYPVFQPQIDIRSGEIVGAEALVRWAAPGYGPVMPCRFIPLLEDAGLIRIVTHRMLKEAIRVAAELRRSNCPCSIGVNVTVSDLLAQRTTKTIFEALRAHDGMPGDLKLELTESSVADSPDTIRWVISRLREEGICTSIDDFGTGYSSLAYLSDFPIQELKIDRSFVSGMTRRPQDRSIVRSTIAMAHEMNLHVVAEGVETEAELELLRGDDCDRAQGFLLSKPLSEPDFVQFVEAAVRSRGTGIRHQIR